MGAVGSGMGGAGGAFAQSFANTLIQGHQVMTAIADRREHLDLQKKLAGAQLQEHDAKTALATRALKGATDLQARLTPQSWPESEFGAGGATTPAPLSDTERTLFASQMDPHGAAKEMLAGGRRISLQDMMTAGTAWMGGAGQPGAVVPTRATPADTALPAAAPVTDQPTAGAAPTPALGPTTKLDRSFSVVIDKNGDPKLDLKVGEKHIALDMKHEFEPLPDGRIQNYRAIFNPDTGAVTRTLVGAPQLPATQQAYAQTAIAWGLKPGTETFAMAIADQAAAATMYQGNAQTLAFEDLAKSYRAMATGKAAAAAPAGAPSSAAAPTTSPLARAQATEVQQAAAREAAVTVEKTKGAREAPIGDDALRFINKRTLQHPQANMKRGDVESSQDYVQVNPAAAPAVRQYQTTKMSLDQLEKIVVARPDLFPVKSGNEMLDIGKVKLAGAKFSATQKTDPDVGRIGTLNITLPATIRLFGDTGNIAIAERAIAEASIGLSPSTRESALARIDLMRALINESAAAIGLPPMQKPSGPKPGDRSTTTVNIPPGFQMVP